MPTSKLLPRRALLALTACILLSACGGSDSDSIPAEATQNPVGNNPPDSAPALTANAAPVINGTPTLSIEAGDYYLFMPVAGDDDGDNLVFSVENLPDWAAFDPDTGTITGIPGDADIGTTANIVLSVSDGLDSSRLSAFSITVSHAALEPASIVVNWLPPTENEDGTSLSDLAAYRIYYGTDPENLDSVIQIDNPGLATYIIENVMPGTWYIGATALNRDGLESGMSNIAEISVG